MRLIQIQNITILDPASEWYGKKADMLIDSGVILKIDSTIPVDSRAEILEGSGLYASVGWVDLRANFCDPGYEFKEDLFSGMECAAFGGYTGVALLPETEPNITNKSVVDYILKKAASSPVSLYPLGGLTSDEAKENLTEMQDVFSAGAKGFSTGYSALNNEGFLMRAMEYAGMLEVPVMVRPENKSIAGKGTVHEGITSVKLGLKGIPAIAETAYIKTILSLCEYTGQPIHVSCVSTKDGMQALETAVKEGFRITADVSIQNLYFDENDLQMFDTNLKLKPPVRSRTDRDYLREAVLKNKFVSVVSDHSPQEEDRKHCEFEIAGCGAIALQTLFSQMLSIYGVENLDQIIGILTFRPRYVLGLDYPVIKESNKAEITIFDPALNWVLNSETNRSKSKNSPLWETILTGKPVAIINNGLLKLLIN